MPKATDTLPVPGFGRLLLLIFAAWGVLAVLTAPGFYRSSSLSGTGIDLMSAIGLALLADIPWALLGLGVLVGNRGVWQRGELTVRAVVLQWGAGLAAIFVLLSLARLWHFPILGLSEALHAAGYGAALFAGLLPGFVIFLALWAGCQAVWLWRRHHYLKRRLVSAELRRLRTQLNPHFLFNALNAISELGYTNPEAADRTITQLSDLLRKSLDATHQREISLRDELDFLGRYLDIQQTLLQGRLEIELQIDDDTLNARVPGMVLQPLAENAVSHGLDRSGKGYLKISAVRRGDSLVIEVEDDGPGLMMSLPNQGREGIGISNTRARLRYLYDGLASLDLLSRPGEGLIARLTIPFHEAYAYDEDSYPDY